MSAAGRRLAAVPLRAIPLPSLRKRLELGLLGQPAAIDAIVPLIQMFESGLCDPSRPVGVVMLLGPTGTGKTHTVETLADVLHRSKNNLLRVDCGEFQHEHEIAKLIGAPPGYSGHCETPPIVSQERLSRVTSGWSKISIILFDEIEKASPALTALLLGILDRAAVTNGKNETVSFSNALIFMTSNLGSRQMAEAIRPAFGFERPPRTALARIGIAEMKRKFTPEFINRIDATVAFVPLDAAAIAGVLDRQIEELRDLIENRPEGGGFRIDITPSALRWLTANGTSPEYGARELRRTIHRNVTQPLAAMIASGTIAPGDTVRIRETGDRLRLRAA